MLQKTIKNTVTTTGIGLHSGKEVQLTLHPADTNTGILFQRTDLLEQPILPATAELVVDTMMSSNIVSGEVRIGTVEHLLSAIAGMGIDNLLIQVSDAEIPIMDGSSADFISLLEKAQPVEQSEKRKFLKITKKVRVEEGDKWVELLPMNGFELNFEIDFTHPAIASTPQVASVNFSTDSYIDTVSQARTFGFMKDIEQLRQSNLALGGSLNNAIVLDEDKIMNEKGLRCADEFVKHKILDAIGDLYLIGYPLLAQYNAYKSGHALNNAIVRQVLADKSVYEIVTIDDKDLPFVY